MARRDLYRATPDLAQDLGYCGLIRGPSYCADLNDKQGILRTFFNLGSNGINKVVNGLQRNRSECKTNFSFFYDNPSFFLSFFYHRFKGNLFILRFFWYNSKCKIKGDNKDIKSPIIYWWILLRSHTFLCLELWDAHIHPRYDGPIETSHYSWQIKYLIL